MEKQQSISVDQLAYNRLAAKNGQLQGQLELVQANYEVLLQEYKKVKEELDKLKEPKGKRKKED